MAFGESKASFQASSWVSTFAMVSGSCFMVPTQGRSRDARPQVPPVKSIRRLLEIELSAGATVPVKGPVNIGFGFANGDIDPMKHHLCLRSSSS